MLDKSLWPLSAGPQKGCHTGHLPSPEEGIRPMPWGKGPAELLTYCCLQMAELKEYCDTPSRVSGLRAPSPGCHHAPLQEICLVWPWAPRGACSCASAWSSQLDPTLTHMLPPTRGWAWWAKQTGCPCRKSSEGAKRNPASKAYKKIFLSCIRRNL